MSEHVDEENVLYLLEIAGRYELQELSNKCSSFLASNVELMKSEEFLELSHDALDGIVGSEVALLPEEDLYDIVVNWKSHQNPSDEVFANILEKIRFPLCSADFLAKVYITGLIPSNMIFEAMCFHAGTKLPNSERPKSWFSPRQRMVRDLPDYHSHLWVPHKVSAKAILGSELKLSTLATPFTSPHDGGATFVPAQRTIWAHYGMQKAYKRRS